MNAARLLELADYIVSPKRAFKWDFGYYKEDTACGTVACALGHAPALWPDFWGWTTDTPELQPALRDHIGLLHGRHGFLDPIECAAEFFDITEDEARDLFMPSSRPGRLPDDATAQEVADSIRRFVKQKEVTE